MAVIRILGTFCYQSLRVGGIGVAVAVAVAVELLESLLPLITTKVRLMTRDADKILSG